MRVISITDTVPSGYVYKGMIHRARTMPVSRKGYAKGCGRYTTDMWYK